MCKVVDAIKPAPALCPMSFRGLAEIVAQWTDASLFWIAVPCTSQPASAPDLFSSATPEFIRSLFADRAAIAPHLRRASVADGAAQLRTYLARLENLLTDGCRFLLASEPCLADFSAAQSIWCMRHSPPIAEVLAPSAKLLTWFGRMQDFGHGTPTDMSGTDAIATVAAASTRAHAVRCHSRFGRGRRGHGHAFRSRAGPGRRPACGTDTGGGGAGAQ